MSTSPTPPTRQRDAPGHDPSRHWGTSPTPPGPKPKHRGRILPAAIGLVLLVATGCAAEGGPTDNDPAPAATPATIPSPNPSTIPVPDPATTPSPDPEPEPFEVPELTGMTRAEAKPTLADIGLNATTRYRSTDQEPAETVISQSPKAGAWALPDTTVRLVVAKTPPPPSTAPPPPTAPEQDCDPSYLDMCLDPAVEDYDCAGGTGNGPEYVEGPIRVLPPDPFDLDREGDGVGCENG